MINFGIFILNNGCVERHAPIRELTAAEIKLKKTTLDYTIHY